VRFDYHRVEKLLNAALLELLKGRKYVAADCKWLAQDRCDMSVCSRAYLRNQWLQDCKWLAQDLSADLLERVKNDQRDAGVRRYKFVTS